MSPRQDAIKSKAIQTDGEVFDLDLAEYKEAYLMEEYLKDNGSIEGYKYLMRSIIFHPRYKVLIGYTLFFFLILYTLHHNNGFF